LTTNSFKIERKDRLILVAKSGFNKLKKYGVRYLPDWSVEDAGFAKKLYFL